MLKKKKNRQKNIQQVLALVGLPPTWPVETALEPYSGLTNSPIIFLDYNRGVALSIAYSFMHPFAHKIR